MVFPTTSSEGWPKVLSEGMAYGVVPLSGNVSSIPQYLQRFGTGRALNPHDISGFADAVATYVQHPEVWQQESAKGMEASHLFSYANYLHAVRQLLGLSTPDQPGGST
jgi:glycosyltransferase involved in cell wall biosynthesis